MADGTTYSIDISARTIGADASAAQINQLAGSLVAAQAVATPFDAAISAAKTNLTAAGAAAAAASAGLQQAEGTFARLEREALKAARAVERAAAKGKDTTALQASADAAAAAVARQATAVDRAASEARDAAAAEKELASSLKTLESAASRSAASMRSVGTSTNAAQRNFGDMTRSATALGGRVGGLVGQITGVVEGLGAGGLAGAAIVAASAILVLELAMVGLVVALGAATFKLLKFAVQANKAVSTKMQKRWERFKKEVTGLFEGVRVDKLLRPMDQLLDLFNKNTASGQALKFLIETLLNPIIEGARKGAPLLVEMFKGGIIAALDLVIVVLRIRNAILRMVPKETRQRIADFIEGIAGAGTAADTAALAVKILAVGVFLLAGAFGALAIAMLIPIGLVVALTALLVGPFVAGVYLIIKSLQKLKEAFTSTGKDAKAGGKEAGTGFVQGILDGITSGVGAIVAAAKGLGKAAVSALKSGLKSKSPSKLTFEVGEEGFAGGLTAGIMRGAPDAEDAATDLGKGAEAGLRGSFQAMGASSGAGGKGAQNGAGSGQPLFGPISITVNAPTGDGEDIAEQIERAFTRLIEGAALQTGAGPIPEAV
jgi:hypothetical protein